MISKMTSRITSSLLLVALAAIVPAVACADAAKPDTSHAAAPAPTPLTMKEVKQKLGMIVYPAKGQTPEQQESDEYGCLVWAADQVGIKPGTPPPDPKAAGAAAAAKVDTATTGVAVKSAAKGAAAGAIIGSISGNAGSGAAYGAAIGGIAGRKAKKQAVASADAEAQKKVEAEQKAKMESLKKAMSACLEPKGYTIK
jgi:hypothetical protein